MRKDVAALASAFADFAASVPLALAQETLDTRISKLTVGPRRLQRERRLYC